MRAIWYLFYERQPERKTYLCFVPADDDDPEAAEGSSLA
jgi:hypothetical protein